LKKSLPLHHFGAGDLFLGKFAAGLDTENKICYDKGV